MTSTLSVSLVVYHPDLTVLRETISSLSTALDRAHDAGLLADARVALIDNGTTDEASLDSLAGAALARPWIRLEVLRGHGNVGYGRAHNLSILHSSAGYHLVLNPDVILAPDAIVEAIRFLDANDDVGMVAPDVRSPSGDREYLCRRYPTVLVLFLRGFAPAPLRRVFRRYMEAHELRSSIGEAVVKGVPLASGCFMFTRLELLRAVGGFSPDYFLYFEDFDLSVRLGQRAALAFVPAVRIVHHGGGAARKGLRHVILFVRGAATFFRTHGWKLA